MNDKVAAARRFSLHVFRVEEGLGNASLLELPDGRFGFVDWGTRHPDAIQSAFELIDRHNIAFIAATHAHADHTMGIRDVLREAALRDVAVERFAYPATSTHKRYAHLTRARETAVDLGVACSAVSVDEFETAEGPQRPPALAIGDGWEVRVLSPGSTLIGKSEIRAMQKNVVPGNDTSMVILFRFYGGIHAGRGLLTGDAERLTLDFARRTAERFPHLELRNDCLFVPHHGARSGVPEWLLDLSDGAVVISGRTDSNYHPARDTLMAVAYRCAASGGKLYCTSYAKACGDAYHGRTGVGDAHLVKSGRCFGDFTIFIDDLQGARLSRSSDPGEARRAYGLCRVSSPLRQDAAEGSPHR